MVNCPADGKSNTALLVAQAIGGQYGKKEMDQTSRRTDQALEKEPRGIGF